MKDLNDLGLPEENGNKKRFRLFDSQREGKGVDKDEAPITPDLKGFFRSFGRNFSKLLSVNLMMVIGNFPVLFAILGLSGWFKLSYMTPVSPFFAGLRNVMLLGGGETPASMALFGVLGMQIENSAMTTTSYILLALSALTFLTFGFIKVGSTYVIRSMIRGEPTFLLADFRYAAKRNKKQAFLFGMLDLLLLLLLPFNLIVMLQSTTTFFASILLWVNIIVSILYCFMRPYIYLQIITFDLKLGKILKNALIFSLLGFKRNILALLGAVLLILLTVFLVMGMGGILMPLGIASPLVILFSAISFMSIFAAWFKIKEIMIDPAEEVQDEEETLPSEE